MIVAVITVAVAGLLFVACMLNRGAVAAGDHGDHGHGSHH